MASPRVLIRHAVLAALVIASSTAGVTGASLFAYSGVLTVGHAAAGGALIGVSIVCGAWAWGLWGQKGR